MFRLILARHGECDGNKENRFRGRSDFPLNDQGTRQARELARALEEYSISAVYSSPLKRAHQVADQIALGSEHKTEILEGYNNVMLGPWEGRAKEEIKADYPKEWEMWKKNPEMLDLEGCESLSRVQKRSVAETEKLRLRHWNDTIVVVTHRAVIKPLLAGLLGISPPYFWKIHIDTCAYSILEYESGLYVLKGHNINHHLTSFIEERF